LAWGYETWAELVHSTHPVLSAFDEDAPPGEAHLRLKRHSDAFRQVFGLTSPEADLVASACALTARSRPSRRPAGGGGPAMSLDERRADLRATLSAGSASECVDHILALAAPPSRNDEVMVAALKAVVDALVERRGNGCIILDPTVLAGHLTMQAMKQMLGRLDTGASRPLPIRLLTPIAESIDMTCLPTFNDFWQPGEAEKGMQDLMAPVLDVLGRHRSPSRVSTKRVALATTLRDSILAEMDDHPPAQGEVFHRHVSAQLDALLPIVLRQASSLSDAFVELIKTLPLSVLVGIAKGSHEGASQADRDGVRIYLSYVPGFDLRDGVHQSQEVRDHLGYYQSKLSCVAGHMHGRDNPGSELHENALV
jgi:hypothetical protein